MLSAGTGRSWTCIYRYGRWACAHQQSPTWYSCRPLIPPCLAAGRGAAHAGPSHTVYVDSTQGDLQANSGRWYACPAVVEEDPSIGSTRDPGRHLHLGRTGGPSRGRASTRPNEGPVSAQGNALSCAGAGLRLKRLVCRRGRRRIELTLHAGKVRPGTSAAVIPVQHSCTLATGEQVCTAFVGEDRRQHGRRP